MSKKSAERRRCSSRIGSLVSIEAACTMPLARGAPEPNSSTPSKSSKRPLILASIMCFNEKATRERRPSTNHLPPGSTLALPASFNEDIRNLLIGEGLGSPLRLTHTSVNSPIVSWGSPTRQGPELMLSPLRGLSQHLPGPALAQPAPGRRARPTGTRPVRRRRRICGPRREPRGPADGPRQPRISRSNRRLSNLRPTPTRPARARDAWRWRDGGSLRALLRVIHTYV